MPAPYMGVSECTPVLHNLTPGLQGVSNQMYGPPLSYFANKQTEAVQMDPHRYSYIARGTSTGVD